MIKRAPGGTSVAHSMQICNTSSEGYIESVCNTINRFILTNEGNNTVPVEYFVMDKNFAIFYNREEIIAGTFFDIEKMRIERWNKLHKIIIERLKNKGIKIENNSYYDKWYK